MEHTIDATNKKLGRIATEAAMILRGKTGTGFAPNVVPNNKVIIENASKVDLSEGRMNETYSRYSGYPGGLTQEKRGNMIKRKGYRVIFEKAVSGMLPKNKLRKQFLKNLIVND